MCCWSFTSKLIPLSLFIKQCVTQPYWLTDWLKELYKSCWTYFQRLSFIFMSLIRVYFVVGGIRGSRCFRILCYRISSFANTCMTPYHKILFVKLLSKLFFSVGKIQKAAFCNHKDLKNVLDKKERMFLTRKNVLDNDL